MELKKKMFELNATTQKSYYGKAQVNIINGRILLYSYNTLVCGYNPECEVFARFWSGWSATTQKHVNDFCRLYGLPTFNKKAWLEMPVTNWRPSVMDLLVEHGKICAELENIKKGV